MLIWPIAVLVTAGIILMILERILPARSLPHVPGWWMRVILINIMQAGVVVLGGLTWEQYLQSLSLVNVPWPNEVFAVATTYFAITFVFTGGTSGDTMSNGYGPPVIKYITVLVVLKPSLLFINTL